MPTAPHIPDEMFVEILSSLPSQDLARVSLASRRLHCISQPLLYTKPVLIDRRGHPPPLQALIRTLLTPGCETLASHVRCLAISWTRVEISQDDDDHASFTAAASRFGLSGWPLSAEIQVMLLLHLLPGLRSLYFCLFDHTSWFHILGNLHSGVQPYMTLPIGLQSLRDFTCDFINGVSPKALAVLLRLPHIRTIAMPIGGDIQLQMRGSDTVRPGSSSVTRLEFPYVRMPHESLRAILQIPHALTHFSYRAMWITRQQTRLKFAEALAPLKNSLQTLVLDFSRRQMPSTSAAAAAAEAPGDKQTIKLHDWPALRHVSTSLLPLLGMPGQPDSPVRLVDLLPAGIHALMILRDNHWSGAEAAHELVMLLEQKGAGVLPLLECVGVCEKMAVTREAEDHLREACETAGVRMTSKSLFAGDSGWTVGNADRRVTRSPFIWTTD